MEEMTLGDSCLSTLDVVVAIAVDEADDTTFDWREVTNLVGGVEKTMTVVVGMEDAGGLLHVVDIDVVGTVDIVDWDVRDMQSDDFGTVVRLGSVARSIGRHCFVSTHHCLAKKNRRCLA